MSNLINNDNASLISNVLLAAIILSAILLLIFMAWALMLDSSGKGLDALVKGRVACAFVVLFALTLFMYGWFEATYGSPSADEDVNPIYYFVLICFAACAVAFIVSSTRQINKSRASEEQSPSSNVKDECV